MKLLTILLFLSFFLGSVILNAQNVTIPDANFKAYLVGNTAINTNGDGEIQVSEAVAFTDSIDCSVLYVSDLTGIEFFTNLSVLNCSFNQLVSLDVSQNINLISLDCGANTNLASLDVSQNTNLINLSCHNNQLASLDISQNISLRELRCSYNQISNLNVTQHINLEVLECYYNQLTGLNVSQNINLKKLNCTSNQLTGLNVSQNINLEELNCNYNQLITLDVTQNPNLRVIYSRNNNLTSLNVRNGNNASISSFYFSADNNPNLTCIEVDDSTYSANNWTNIDPTASFSTNCGIFSNTTSIDETINATAYPNPTTKDITLDLGRTYHEATIQVTNLTGQAVLNKTLVNTSTTTLELNGAVGVYFVTVRTQEGTVVLKVVKE